LAPKRRPQKGLDSTRKRAVSVVIDSETPIDIDWRCMPLKTKKGDSGQGRKDLSSRFAEIYADLQGVAAKLGTENDSDRLATIMDASSSLLRISNCLATIRTCLRGRARHSVKSDSERWARMAHCLTLLRRSLGKTRKKLLVAAIHIMGPEADSLDQTGWTDCGFGGYRRYGF
jgi:hypothetical protein